MTLGGEAAWVANAGALGSGFTSFFLAGPYGEHRQAQSSSVLHGRGLQGVLFGQTWENSG